MARLLLAALWLHGGAAARAEPLAAMLAKVYLTNPRLEAGRANLRAIDESVPQARAARRPQVTAHELGRLQCHRRGAAEPAPGTQRHAEHLRRRCREGLDPAGRGWRARGASAADAAGAGRAARGDHRLHRGRARPAGSRTGQRQRGAAARAARRHARPRAVRRRHQDRHLPGRVALCRRHRRADRGRGRGQGLGGRLPAPDRGMAGSTRAAAGPRRGDRLARRSAGAERGQLGVAGGVARAGGGARCGQRHAGRPEAEPEPGWPGRLRHG